jgi:hypothetical protein
METTIDNVLNLKVRRKDTDKLIAIAENFGGCRHQRAIVDRQLAELTCADCGVKLNPIEFLVGLATQERIYKMTQENIAASRAALESRKRCRCTKCGQWTEIRRVGNRELKRIASSNDGETK